MKKFLLAAALVGATSSFALAADLPSRRAPPVYVPPVVPTFTWTGMYAGLNAGYAFNGYSYDTLTPLAPTVGASRAPFFRQSASGFTGGGQIGYNYQLGGGLPVLGSVFGNGGATGGFVIGVEADAAYTSESKFSPYIDAATGNLSVYNSKTDFVGTARGRVGYAFGDLLIFGTGGFAYGDVRNNLFLAGATSYTAASSGLRTGYAYGGGAEYAIPTTSFVNFFHSSAVTVKVEYLHYELGSQTLFAAPSTGVGGYIESIKTKGDLARVGINYKVDFGSPAPVVARY